MPVSSEFREFVRELFAPSAAVEIRAMFGGAGIFHGGLMIALIVDDRLYLKTDEDTRPAFEAAGCEPFRYERRKRTVAFSYYELPASAHEDSEEMAQWAARAIAASRAIPTARKRRDSR